MVVSVIYVVAMCLNF